MSFASSSDVAVHAAQRMDGDGDSQWVVPGDPTSQPSVRWPSARSPVSGTVKPNSSPPRGQVASERSRVNPEEVWESGKKRVLGLEAAISAMIANGIDETSSEVTSLKDSLAKAGRNAQEPSASIQLQGAKEFVERARKRLAAHDAQRAVLEKELVDGETRVQRLEVEVSVVPPRSTELDAEVSQLKAKLAMMEAEQQRLREGAAGSLHAERMTDEVPSVAGIPPLPHHAEEVEQWLIDRNCELRSALRFLYTPMIAHTHRQGCQQVFHCRIREGQSRSSLMAALIGGVSKPVRSLPWWVDFEECESGRLRTQDRDCFTDTEDPGEVLWLLLRMMMMCRCSLKAPEKFCPTRGRIRVCGRFRSDSRRFHCFERVDPISTPCSGSFRLWRITPSPSKRFGGGSRSRHCGCNRCCFAATRRCRFSGVGSASAWRLILWIQMMSMTMRSHKTGPAVDDDDFEPSQQFGRFTALAEPTKPRSRRLVLVSLHAKVDLVPTTVPDSVDVVHVNLTDGEVGALSDTESNRTVPSGWMGR